MQKVLLNSNECQPAQLVSFEQHKQYLECADQNGLLMRIYVISNEILRFRYAIDGIFENDFSYAIDEHHPYKSVPYEINDNETHLILSTKTLQCHIQKHNFHCSIYNNEGTLLSHDEKGFHWEPNHSFGGNVVKMSKDTYDYESFYGLGDKPTNLNIRHKRFKNWGMDEYGYEKDTDPLYKNIPIYYCLNKDIAYGIFFDNSFESHFDFALERSEVVSFWAQGGEMNYYFIYGPTLMQSCSCYTQLTGTPTMPPLWALGFQQCKWSYYPEQKVKEIATKFRELKIPCDAIYLDIDYMDGFRCFTWDNDKFPNPKKMVQDLNNIGFKTMVIIDPGIKKDKGYFVFDEGLANGYFCKYFDGQFYEGKVWPGLCYFPDFTNPKVREWWATLFKELVSDIGVAGVWNDMNEPAIFEVEGKTFPNRIMHDYDGNTTSHRKAHNIYGLQMARATAEGFRQNSNNKRGLIITRSGYSGLQRYSSVWTGDNIATWQHLWLASVQVQRLAISGVSFAGSDIGGFIGQPSAELMIRWIQTGIFHPFCRVHSSSDDGDQEPWVFGDQCTAIFKKYIELRYRLLPYLYTTFYQYHNDGVPFIRPLIFYDQTDHELLLRDNEFMCGNSILVAPILTKLDKGQSTSHITQSIYLPKGTWYDFVNHEIYAGRSHYQLQLTLAELPIFIKGGSLLPMYPLQQYVGEKKITTLFLRFYFQTGTFESQWYDDDHTSYQYEKDAKRISNFKIVATNSSIQIEHSIQGSYQSLVTQIQLTVIGAPFELNEVTVDQSKSKQMSHNTVTVAHDFKQLKLT